MFNFFKKNRVAKEISTRLTKIEALINTNPYLHTLIFNEIDKALALAEANKNLSFTGACSYLLTLKAEVITKTSSPNDEDAYSEIIALHEKAYESVESDLGAEGCYSRAEFALALAEVLMRDISGNIANKKEKSLKFYRIAIENYLKIRHENLLNVYLNFALAYKYRELDIRENNLCKGLSVLEEAVNNLGIVKGSEDWKHIIRRKSQLLGDFRSNRIVNNTNAINFLTEILPDLVEKSDPLLTYGVLMDLCIKCAVTDSNESLKNARDILSNFRDSVKQVPGRGLEKEVDYISLVIDSKDYFDMNTKKARQIDESFNQMATYFKKGFFHEMWLDCLIAHISFCSQYFVLDEGGFKQSIEALYQQIKDVSLERVLFKHLSLADVLVMQYYHSAKNISALLSLSKRLASKYKNSDPYIHHLATYFVVKSEADEFAALPSLPKAIQQLQQMIEFFEKNKFDLESANAQLLLGDMHQYCGLKLIPYKQEKAILLWEEANTASGSTKEFAKRFVYGARFYGARKLWGKAHSVILSLHFSHTAIQSAFLPYDWETSFNAKIIFIKQLLDEYVLVHRYLNIVHEDYAGRELPEGFQETVHYLQHLFRQKENFSDDLKMLLRVPEEIKSMGKCNLLVDYAKSIIAEYECVKLGRERYDVVLKMYISCHSRALEYGNLPFACEIMLRLTRFVNNFSSPESNQHLIIFESLVQQKKLLSKASFNKLKAITSIIEASLYALVNDWGKANESFDRVFQNLKGEDELQFTDFLDEFYDELLIIPFSMLNQNKLASALEYSELISSQKLFKNIAQFSHVYSKSRERQALSRELREHQLSELLMPTGEFKNKLAVLDHMDRIDRLFAGWNKEAEKLSVQLKRPVLIPFLSNENCYLVLILPSTGVTRPIISDKMSFGRNQLERLLHSRRNGLSSFFEKYETPYEDKATSQRKWEKVMSNMTQRMHDYFGKFIYESVGCDADSGFTEIAIVPQASMHNLPFTLLSVNGKGNSDNSHYCFSLVGSLGMLKHLEQRTFHDCPNLAFIPQSELDANSKLMMTPIEKSLCMEQFAPEKVNSCDTLENALEVLSESNYWHFSTHGQFDSAIPETSHIQLDRKVLLEHLLIFETKKSLRLVVLAMCDAGKTDYKSNANNVLSLTYKFFELGAAAVVGTLWTIADESSLVLCKFYEFHLKEQLSPTIALLKAQLWFKELTARELLWYVNKKIEENVLQPDDSKSLIGKLKSIEDLDKKYFQDPYWWAGFVLHGA